MDLYILDDVLRRTSVVDRFESLIWTERYSSLGDFELVIHSTPENRALFQEGAMLGIVQSTRVMVVEVIADDTDADGRKVLKITGQSLEKIMLDRVAAIDFTPPFDKWVLTNQTPGNIARTIFNRICRSNTQFPQDNIPFLVAGSLYRAGNIAEPVDPITVEIERKSVYEALKELCDAYNLGFRLHKGPDTSKLYFDVYTGNDRTASQSLLTPVVFSSALDNLTNISQLTSTANAKNVAYVWTEKACIQVFSDGADANTSGFQRRVLQVDATDVDLDPGPELLSILEQRGKDALAKHRALRAFDGEIPQFGSYRYGMDYELGDLVEIFNADGEASQMRVTEQIFVSDSEGDRSYPTLTINLLITPGSWLSWDGLETWEMAQGTWDDFEDRPL